MLLEPRVAGRLRWSRYEVLDAYVRAANYLGAIQLYLRDNVLLERPLRAADIKPRLLGHWGTQPGLNLIYAHLNRLAIDTDAQMLLVVGPGHGAPAIYANLYLEETLALDDRALTQGRDGMRELARRFSWPDGNPSHVTAATRGAIHEGGELGYSLAHAFGAAFDNPELIVPCIIGDGEAETGPLAASWLSNRYLDPRGSGAVLPILHLNGARLSGPTLLGRMSQAEIGAFVESHGYEPLCVDVREPISAHVALAIVFDRAYERIVAIQNEARSGPRAAPPRWPCIVLRSQKGMTGPAELDGKRIAGTFRSHGIPINDPAGNPAHLTALEDWLRSYRPHELFAPDGTPRPIVMANVPHEKRRLGRAPCADPGHRYRPLLLPDVERHAVAVPEPGESDASAAGAFGAYLRDVITLNARKANFRIFSPDETISNKIDPVFGVTDRAMVWRFDEEDDAEGYGPDGRVMEILSEHACEGWLEGYLLTGRHGIFVSYEAFATIVDSMLEQYAKWLKVAAAVRWRRPPASLNVFLTSHVWRQEHNGFSHQGPGLINQLLSKKRDFVRAYLPPDANTTLACVHRALGGRGLINVIVAPKQTAPQWLDIEPARVHVERKADLWDWAGSAGDPHVVLACAGDVPTLETLAAVDLLHGEFPELRVRVVNVVDLLALDAQAPPADRLDDAAFVRLFGERLPVVFAYHGYPDVIHELIHRRPNPERFHVRGYIEEGATTTPFDIVSLNKMSRYHLMQLALDYGSGRHKDEVAVGVDRAIAQARKYAREHGTDPPEIAGWRWKARKSPSSQLFPSIEMRA
ncbi:MAG: phosphoketolase family protein [Candidatus Eremiobacteraeota bacterium]|nr:phosphoketolase family protein [Candidatus Eremiobacteraeota bacterium]